jgi:hypothetical protein
MGPQAFSMASGHGYYFRIRLTEKTHFPPLFAQCKAYRMSVLFKRFGPYSHSMGRVLGCLEQLDVALKKDIQHCR